MSQPAGRYLPPGAGPSDRRSSRVTRLAVFALAVVGGLAGTVVLWMHLTGDPLTDARAYYDSASRLNDGLPLYPPKADPDVAEFYRYPPLLAVALRPLALLPYEAFAIGWEAVVVGSFVLLLRRLGMTARTWAAVGLLGIPIGWALGVAQAHVPVTLLLTIGQPWSIALAANVKLFPVLVAVWWIGRRRWQALGALAGWLLLLGAAQAILEPDGSRAFLGTLTLDQVGDVRNFSPYTISPLLWLALVGAGGVAALVAAPTRWGWAAAVALASLAYPRLLVYMLMGLLAGLREPDSPTAGRVSVDGVPQDPAEAYVKSAR